MMKQGIFTALFVIVFCFWGLLFSFSCNDNDDDPSTSSGQAPDDNNENLDDDDEDSDDDDSSDDDDNDDDDSDDDVDDDTDDDDSDSDVWTDSSSGLMWQNGSEVGWDRYKWYRAKVYCRNLDWGGYDDWRLPTIGELRSLIRGCDGTEPGGDCGVRDDCLESDCWSSSCTGCTLLAGPGPGGVYWPHGMSGFYSWYGSSGYWSSTPVADDPYYWWSAWYEVGGVYHVGGYLSVRCVRQSTF